jgi:branched-chain amino acid transport system permease protein
VTDPASSGPDIGSDEWVARKSLLEEAPTPLQAALRRLPVPAWFAVAMVASALFPIVVTSDYVVRVGVNTIIYALLALGLNVVVGWAGLLDLGYVAFFGFGGYSYALLSSGQFDLHWPTLASVPLVVVASTLLGILIGLPSRRLLGDYLAILTLFFAQAFVTVVSNANRITPPGHEGAVDFTGGPNGIAGIDPFHIGSFAVTTVRGYFYLSLAAFIFIAAALYSINNSRIGRAWRSLREDPLAAQLMGMPVNWLKLAAFAFGAAIAGLTGTMFVALQVGVFPTNFDIALLITIYAMVILGGAGSMTGVVFGAIAINVVLEVLRTPDAARWVFYIVVVLGLLRYLRPYRRLAAVVAGTIALGVVVHIAATHLAPAATRGEPLGGGVLGRLADHWVVLLTNPTTIGNIAYAILLLAVAFLTQMRGAWRVIMLVPTLYLAAFVWENRLVENPSVARLIIVGALLVALMNARPQGLLGTARIEIA